MRVSVFTAIGHSPTLAVYKFAKEYTMGKSYHTKKKYRQGVDEIVMIRERRIGLDSEKSIAPSEKMFVGLFVCFAFSTNKKARR